MVAFLVQDQVDIALASPVLILVFRLQRVVWVVEALEVVIKALRVVANFSAFLLVGVSDLLQVAVFKLLLAAVFEVSETFFE